MNQQDKTFHLYIIRPLSWIDTSKEGGYIVRFAETPFAKYDVSVYKQSVTWGYTALFDPKMESFDCASIDDGMAFAQAHWVKVLEEHVLDRTTFNQERK